MAGGWHRLRGSDRWVVALHRRRALRALRLTQLSNVAVTLLASGLQSLVAQWIGQILSSFDLTQQLKPNQKLLVRRLPHGTFFSTK